MAMVFVGDQDAGTAGEHHADHDPLAHATGQFMRIGAGDPPRPGDTHRLSISMASDIASSRPQPCCKEKTLPIWCPILMVGFRADRGATAVMDGAFCRRFIIPNTFSLAVRIGRAVLDAGKLHQDPGEAVVHESGGAGTFGGRWLTWSGEPRGASPRDAW